MMLRYLVSLALLCVVSVAASPGAVAAPRLLDLAQVHGLARAHNPNLKILAERVRQADLLINRAWSTVLPRLSASASVTRNSDEVTLSMPVGAGPPQSITIVEAWNKRFGLSASVALFNARAIPLIKNAHDNHQAARLSSAHQRAELLLVVSSTYYQVHAAKQLVRTAKENLATARRFEQEAAALRRVGSATSIDALRARLRVNAANKALADAEDGVKLARAALATLMGLRRDAFTLAAPPAAAPATGDLATLTRRALRSRRDLRALRLARRMAGRGRTEAWLGWVPVLDATYRWSYDSAGGFSGSNDSWQLIFGARWSLLEGGQRVAAIAERRSQLRVAQHELSARDLTIRRQVRQGQLQLSRAERNFRLAGRQLELARQTYDMVSKQYRAGVASSLEVVSAGTELERRRVSRVVGQLERDLARLRLRRALGHRGPAG